MGHPKMQRKKYETPFKPYYKDRIEREKKLLAEFGLRRKHEIQRAESILRDFRRRARELLAKKNDKKEKELFDKVNKYGFNCSKLEDILGLNIENILSRRLQTIIFKKNFASTSKHARQMIVHGHVIVDDRRISWPSFLVPTELEAKIQLSPKIKNKIIAGEKDADTVSA
ncbi:MAG: 30S ribosomal protein S4 [Candidatus Aenigmatarchaeota archaeon]